MSFFISDPGAKQSAYNLLLQTLSHKSPGLHEHLTRLPGHDPDSYLCDMFTSLFTSHLALDEAARLWDVYVFEGDAILVRAAVALLLQQEMSLLGAGSAAELAAVLESGGGCSAADNTAKKTPTTTGSVLARNGADDRWIRAVREAGKA